jgi:hypothetical protein
MPKPPETADLPAPLSLTLDEACKVAGGALPMLSAAVLHPIYWYGQPVAPWVNLSIPGLQKSFG